jgi:hypothetical protein
MSDLHGYAGSFLASGKLSADLIILASATIDRGWDPQSS